MKRIVCNVYAEKRIDSAYSAEQAREILQNNSFDFVIVDIPSVNSWAYQILKDNIDIIPETWKEWIEEYQIKNGIQKKEDGKKNE